MVSAIDPPWVGVMDSEEAHQTQDNANCAQRWAEEQHQAVPYPRPTPRVRRGRTTDIQQPSSQLGCGVGMCLMTVKFRQPSHEFTFDVDMSFILYPLVLTPLV
jgi:hypothetical protein